MLRTLAQFTREVPEISDKKEVSALDIMNAAIQIGHGGKGRLQSSKDKLKALDYIEGCFNNNRIDELERIQCLT